MSKELQTAPVAWILAYDDVLQGKIESLQIFSYMLCTVKDWSLLQDRWTVQSMHWMDWAMTSPLLLDMSPATPCVIPYQRGT